MFCLQEKFQKQKIHKRHWRALKSFGAAKFCNFLLKFCEVRLASHRYFPEMGTWQIGYTLAFY